MDSADLLLRTRRDLAEPDTALGAAEAARLADWYGRYALDRVLDQPQRFHPALAPHLKAQTVQSRAVVALLDEQLPQGEGPSDSRAGDGI